MNDDKCGWVFWKIEERLKWSGVYRRYMGEDYGRGYYTLCSVKMWLTSEIVIIVWAYVKGIERCYIGGGWG